MIAMMPASQYLESRNGGYYVAGSRIGLDVVVYAFRRGKTAEDIFHAYPFTIGSLAKVYGVITYILEHPQEIEAYLQNETSAFEEFQATHPLRPEMLEPFERIRIANTEKPA
jgi:uncharacterized protein (DUF433 family)